MKKLIFLILFISIICSCDLFFTGPHATNFHKENEIEGFSQGNFISKEYSSLYNAQVDYSFNYYYYLMFNENNIEIYVLDENYEIYDAMKGSYTLEYSYYNRYDGSIDYTYVYDKDSDSFIEINRSSDFSILRYYTEPETFFHFLINNFNGLNIYGVVFETESTLYDLGKNR